MLKKREKLKNKSLVVELCDENKRNSPSAISFELYVGFIRVGSYTTWGEEIVTLPMVRVVLRNTEYEEDKAHKR